MFGFSRKLVRFDDFKCRRESQWATVKLRDATEFKYFPRKKNEGLVKLFICINFQTLK